MLLTHITNGINGCSLNVHTQAGMREETSNYAAWISVNW
jgi:hypothetical protein